MDYRQVRTRYLLHIKNSDVLAKLAEGKSVAECSQFFGCSPIVIRSIQQGKRKEPSPTMLNRIARLHNSRQKPCTCCGLYPVKKGNRFLCEECYQIKDSAFEECVSLGPSPRASY